MQTFTLYNNKGCKKKKKKLVKNECLQNSRKQEVIAQFSVEVEYIAVTGVSNQAICLRKILNDLGFIQNQAIVSWVHNKLAIAIVKNLDQCGRTKHISVKYHAIREVERSKEITLMHCRSEEQFANILTKSLPKIKFNLLKEKLGVFKKNLKEEC